MIGTVWLPERGSTFAAGVDFNWNLVFWISAFFFALVTFLLVLFVLRYRERPGYVAESAPSHSTSLEIFWSVVPTIIVVGLFWSGYRTYLDMATPPAGAYEIQVTGQKWNWLFTYPNGYVDGRAARPRAHAGAARDDLAGRAARVLRAGVPRQAGRDPRALHVAVVRGARARDARRAAAPSTAARATRPC